MKYIVEVKGPLPDDLSASLPDIAKVLKLNEAQAARLLEQMPGVITRPISQIQATSVANALRQHGLRTLLKIHEPVSVRSLRKTWPDSLESIKYVPPSYAQRTRETFERAKHLPWRRLYRIGAIIVILLGLSLLASLRIL